METRGVNAASSPVTSPSSVATGVAPAEKNAKTKKVAEAVKDATGSGAVAGKNPLGLDISPKARELSDSFKKATEIARSTPDVREDRVAAIKQKLADGKYEMDSGKIADGIMREAILDHLAEGER